MKRISRDDVTLYYEITYKDIKHLYMRFKDGVWQITSSKHYSEKEIDNLVNKEFDRLAKKQQAATNQVATIPKYRIFDKVYSEQEFYQAYGFPVDDKYYHAVLQEALYQKLLQLSDWLKTTISVVKINLVPIHLKVFKGKYGSCNVVKKEVTINLFMARLPVIYLKYVLLHEFAHLKVANHSAKFYQILDKLMLDHRKIQKDLRKIPITFG